MRLTRRGRVVMAVLWVATTGVIGWNAFNIAQIIMVGHL